ncbi:DNA helicase MCM9 isoform X2 [Siniperca chuatsi]|uniref:DNA helicase MCM9 isoform X2 n=1 Tax=Siniperca chuatsi TaxID=119488 RepID=UPI001CE20CD7|nr:DNA helicase MCM9 isoform X2 [Siniperca chuatsi]
MLINPEQEALIGRVFESYLTEHHHGDILQLIAETNEETHHPVVVNAMTLFEANMEVGDYFNAYPNDVLAIFDKVLHRTAMELSENSSPKHYRGPGTTEQRMRHTLHARITGLPVCPELTRDTIPRSRDVGHFLSVTGTVIRTSVTKVLEYERDYMCVKCRHVFTAQADFDQSYTFLQPVACPNPNGCNSYKFSCLSGSEPAACRDYQEIKIQEQVQRLSVGSIPRSMVVVLEDDLVDSCKSGECHMLLVGDPGTGKSQFLKYAAKIMPRSVLTAGIGSTSAGLTVAAVKDGGDWHLEAGALVLSDGGLCCIDEFNSIKEHDRISIHEAMEQQSISVAKAGMVCKLNTRTTILAATNPKGQYDPSEPLSVNVALASPLLSRFDLVLVLLDTRNAEWDRIISSFILEDRGLPAESSSLWSMDKMKAYFSVIKRLQPQVSEEANSILTRYYQLQRQSDGRNAARTTIRMLESLSRLAEAHARLMYRETATIEDAVMAVSVMECSMQGAALLGNVNALLTSFPADPGQQYQTRCQILLEGLNLPLLLQKEMDRLARLKSNTSDASQFDPPTYNNQHQLRDTNSINKSHCHDSTSNCKGDVTVESGLDWFHSITPSLVHGMASPILTSTQENLSRKPNSSWSEMSTVTKQPNCPTEKDILSNTGSTLNHSVVSNPFGSITCASEEENRQSKKNENLKEKSSIRALQEEIKQSQRQEDKKHAESVFQKVSKKLRDRRLRELELNPQQCDKEGGGGHGERVVSGDSASKNVTDVLDPTECHTSSTLSSGNGPSNNLVQDTLSSGIFEKGDKREQTGTKNISAVLREKMAAEAETGEGFHAKLSGFIFKPRKMIPSVHNHELNASSEFQAECIPASRDLHTHTRSRISTQKPVSHDDSSEDPLTGTEKKKRQNQYQDVLEGEGRRNLSSVSEEGESSSEGSVCFTSEELRKDGFSFDELAQGKTVDGIKGSDGTENLCQQQRTSTSDETKVDGFTCTPPSKPSTCMNDPALSRAGCTKSTVATSTLDKLSRFSFTCTTEPTTTAKVGKNPPTGVKKSPLRRDRAECSRANSKDEETINSLEHRRSAKKIKTVVTMGKVKDRLPPPATELTPGQEHEEGTESPAKTMSKCRARQIVNDGPVDYQSTVHLKKRKCFELGPPPSSVGGSKGLFSGLSPFGSVELSNDVFDTDWDQEFSKKAKN